MGQNIADEAVHDFQIRKFPYLVTFLMLDTILGTGLQSGYMRSLEYALCGPAPPSHGQFNLFAVRRHMFTDKLILVRSGAASSRTSRLVCGPAPLLHGQFGV